MTAEIGGWVAPGFEAVRDAFARNFEDHGDIGASYALYVEGQQVVDLWGGVRDVATGETYDEDTLQLVFSTTKGATAACANLLAQRGLLDIDAPVVEYWPEFGQAGKEQIPVRWLLTHQAGLPTIDARLTLDEALAWEPVIHALEAQAPFWEPGTAHGYHAVTYGYLVGEVVRRIDGRSLGSFFHDEFAEPLGLEFWIGLPEEFEPRVAPLINDAGGEEGSLAAVVQETLGADALITRALSLNGAFDLNRGANSRAFHAAEIPAANGITNGRSLARFLRGPDRHRRRRSGRADADQGAGRPGPHVPHVRRRPGHHVPRHRGGYDDRSRFLDRVAARALRRGRFVRPFGHGRIGRIRGSRSSASPAAT